MYKNAAESVSTEDTVPLVVDVVHIDDSSMELTEDGDTQFVIDDVTWIMAGNTICHIFIHLLRKFHWFLSKLFSTGTQNSVEVIDVSFSTLIHRKSLAPWRIRVTTLFENQAQKNVL